MPSLAPTAVTTGAAHAHILKDCTFDRNYASGRGGAVALARVDCGLEHSASTLIDNLATAGGGAVHVMQAPLAFEHARTHAELHEFARVGAGGLVCGDGCPTGAQDVAARDDHLGRRRHLAASTAKA